MAGVKDFVNTVQKKFGKEVIAGDNRAGVEFLPSGSLSLDLALGGGYAKGRIIELMGYESCGKTTLALHACLSAQNEGKAVLYVDRENAIDIDYVEALGIDTDPEKFILTQPGVAEECFEIIREAIKTDEIGVIVLDSVAALFPKCYLDADVGDTKMGTVARIMSTWLPGFVGDIKRNNIVVIFINQYRDKIGVMFGDPRTTPGGKALGFYSSQRLDIARAGAAGDKGEEFANHVKVKVTKNKVAPPFRKAEFDIRFGEGIDKALDILNLAVEKGVVEKAGSFFKYGGKTLAQGAEKTRDVIAEDEDLMARIEEEIMQNI